MRLFNCSAPVRTALGLQCREERVDAITVDGAINDHLCHVDALWTELACSRLYQRADCGLRRREPTEVGAAAQ